MVPTRCGYRAGRWGVLLAVGWSVVVPQTLPRACAQQTMQAGGVEVRADELEYQARQRLLIGRGHVVILSGPDVLRADQVTFQVDTQDAHARGNVVLERPGALWRGHEARYNFKTQTGNFGAFEYYAEPYYIRASESRQVAPNELVLQNAVLTTCAGDRPLVYLRAREARVIDENRLKAKGVWLCLGGLPLFWMPYVSRRLDDTGLEVVPGHSSRMGYYLLTAYTARLFPQLLSTTHLDYRTKRGFGVGQDFAWAPSLGGSRGLLSGYYANDRKPFRNADEETQWNNLVDADRYRLRLADVRSLSSRDYVVTELNYLSDPRVIEEFFDEEFRQRSQPENRVSLIHRGDRFTAGLTLNARLNDFFGNVNRLPEATLDLPRQQLGDSPLYYESANSAARLERVFPRSDEEEDYDAFRIDSGHTLYYPTRHFGFLNVIPRGGYRATYYSTSYEHRYVTNEVLIVVSNVVVGTTNQVDTITRERSGLRNVYEAGLEASFKAFRVIHDEPIGRDFRGLRHVVEPSARHTYIPEPNLRPSELPQFDAVDRVDRQHDVYFGVRNKLQSKRRLRGVAPADPARQAAAQRLHDFVDAGVFTTYRIEPEEGENAFGNVDFDARLRLVDWWPVDVWGSFDPYESEMTAFRTELAWLNLTDDSHLSLEYLYRKDRRDQLSVEGNLFPRARWSFRTYWRYALDRSKLEEQAYVVEHKTDCLGVGVGYKEVEDDQQVWIQVWLTAFPKTYIKMGR